MEKEITIKVEDADELYSALNNSLIALKYIYDSMSFYCELPFKWEEWVDKQIERGKSYQDCIEILKHRIELQRDLMEQIKEYI